MIDDFVRYGDYKEVLQNRWYEIKGRLTKEVKERSVCGVVLINVDKEIGDDCLYFELWREVFDKMMYDGFSQKLDLYFVCRNSNTGGSPMIDLVVECIKRDSDTLFFTQYLKDNTKGFTSLIVDYPKRYFTDKDKESLSIIFFKSIKNKLPNYISKHLYQNHSVYHQPNYDDEL